MESLVPPPRKILVVDDEPGLRQMLEILFKRQGYVVTSAPGFRAAAESIAKSPQPFPVVLTDLAMPDGSGLDVLAAAKQRNPATEVILITAHSTLTNAVAAMRSGAYDFVTKPFEPAELTALVEKALEKQELVSENQRLRARASAKGDEQLVGKSAAMRGLLSLVERIAPTRTTVLITGESGTGKESVARAIHDQSDRSQQPFLVVNCGALPESLMESELFGHEKGAFTGATGKQRGLFREADGGTLLLDEVGELPTSLQVKLLRVLQERKVRPVGSAQEVAVDVRLLAATNRDVEADVESGRFRQDLYYRLNVIRMGLPPLRERQEDIAPLAERFVARFASEMGKEVVGFTNDALRALTRYPFPGNVRELENVIERAVILQEDENIIVASDLPEKICNGEEGNPSISLRESGITLEELERKYMVKVLSETGWHKKRAADVLGINPSTLYRKIKAYGLHPPGSMAANEDDFEYEDEESLEV
jgi:two-component system response regulator PilR (NtrC family)